MNETLSVMFGLGAWASVILLYLLYDRMCKAMHWAFVGIIATFAGLHYAKLFLIVPGLVLLISGSLVALGLYARRVYRARRAEESREPLSVSGRKPA